MDFYKIINNVKTHSTVLRVGKLVKDYEKYNASIAKYFFISF